MSLRVSCRWLYLALMLGGVSTAGLVIAEIPMLPPDTAIEASKKLAAMDVASLLGLALVVSLATVGWLVKFILDKLIKQNDAQIVLLQRTIDALDGVQRTNEAVIGALQFCKIKAGITGHL